METDDHLLALCAAWHRAQDIAESDAPLWQQALDETGDLTDAIMEIPATTEPGRRAKAGVAARLFAVEHRDDRDCQFVAAVLSDLADDSVVGAAVAAPDAMLIALCDDTVAAQGAFRAFVDGCPGDADDEVPGFRPVVDRLDRAMDRLSDGPPLRTLAGAVALARAAFASIACRTNGEPDLDGYGARLAYEVCEFLAGQRRPDPRPPSSAPL